jgi:hypothetical protein
MTVRQQLEELKYFDINRSSETAVGLPIPAVAALEDFTLPLRIGVSEKSLPVRVCGTQGMEY